MDIPSNDPEILSKLDLIPFFVCYKNKQIIIMFVKFIDKKQLTVLCVENDIFLIFVIFLFHQSLYVSLTYKN